MKWMGDEEIDLLADKVWDELPESELRDDIVNALYQAKEANRLREGLKGLELYAERNKTYIRDEMNALIGEMLTIQ